MGESHLLWAFEKHLDSAFASLVRLNEKMNIERDFQWIPDRTDVTVEIGFDKLENVSYLKLTTRRPES